MAFVSVTRLRLRSARFLPGFAWRTWASLRQLRRSPGFHGGYVALERGLGFWTVTLWDDEAAMRAYRAAGAHGPAMKKLIDWCDEASVAHWQADVAAPPGAAEALRRMIADGRLSKVRHPSPRHAAGGITDAATVLRPGRAVAKRADSVAHR